MDRRSIIADDGRELNAFVACAHPDAPVVVVVLPFGARHAMLNGFYDALRSRFTVVTWESRFVLDVERDDDEAGIAALTHARDLASVIRATARRGRHEPVDVIAYCSGAGVALLAAQHYPDAISRLVLVSGEYLLPAAVAAQTDIQRQMDIFLSLAAKSRSVAGSIQEKIAAAQERGQTGFHTHLREPFSSALHLHRYGINYLAYRGVDLREVARQVAHPALSIVSTADMHVDPAGSLDISRLLRRCARNVCVTGDHYEICRGNADIVDSVVAFLVTGEATLRAVF
ncbi:alpha/beta hydrolase [Burkholderia pseudomallei]|uniref:alpha/beta fold hydrolase n=1 Tax=Burkholderia pseudomallei TaxID=28450 RepID=UPI00050E7628|nr:alpha/beta hydrolase [Burkholderia pseudomallei]AIV55593.1 alpha/beta hydrolase family protein [Burkholderia pseudomallei MSHR1153]AYE31450.1 alpha/beta hydrolase [Burkholderia pseudomallei]KGC71060.1 alpha/beta hydrolase family protein [Burkholderia pseudomallei]KGD38685.1 alpha/beta hydrolase family protein [Burkholderia pseudomallei]KGD49645.1 alpha/beta hydrolase family protein [Burkholderia pseudomallei]